MADIIGTEGNDNPLNGTPFNDRIWGLGGNDKLYGKAGNDELYGGTGDDTLHGDAGADLMYGGTGNDTYYIDDAGDVISEETVPGVDDGGTDRVYATFSYVMANYLERATLYGTYAGFLTGNSQNNKLTGNSAANTLTGGLGLDELVGGGGADIFMFGTASASSTDKITDFATEDWIGIRASDYGLTEGNGLVNNGSGKLVLDGGYFATVSSGTQGTASGHGQFVYNTSTRSLMWDSDGAGTAASGISLTTFKSTISLAASDFEVVVSPPPAPTVAIGNGTPNPQTEDVGATITFVFSLSSVATENVVITYSTVDGTAVAGSDFNGVTSGQAIILAGQLTTSVPITLIDDSTIEGSEAFTLRIDSAVLQTSGTPVTVTTITGAGNITDDDTPPPLPTAAVADGTPNPQLEANGAQVGFTISLSAVASEDVILNYSTVNGTAAAGTDFTGITNAQATITAGNLSTTIFVDLLNDSVFETAEAFSLQLNSAQLAVSSTLLTITDPSGAGNITDDDTPPPLPTAAVADGTPNPQLEANGAQVGFTISLSAVASEDVILNYSTVNGTAAAGTDFTGLTNAQATITAGNLSTTIFVDLLNDSVFETAEAFSLQLNSAQLAVSSTLLTITDDIGAGNITDDDAPPPLPTAAVADGTPNPQLEANGAQVGFTISLSAVASEDVILNYSTVNGTAAAGTDFTGITNAQATITAGNLSTTIFVDLLNDSVFETAEAFSLQLNSAQLAVSSTLLTITDPSGAGNITDDDTPPPLPTAAVANGAPNPQTEATGAQVGFTISLNAAATEDVILTYSTVNGTAAAGTDFTGLTNAQATITAGNLSTTVFVDLLNDSVFETAEAFSLQLNSAQLAVSSTLLTITDDIGAGNITDDDAPPPLPTAAVADGTPSPQLEANGAQVGFTISLSAVASEDVILNYSTVNGTAAAGTDFTGLTNAQATITAGNLSTTVFVDLLNDSVFETAEAFSLQLNSAQLAVSSTLLTITDDIGAGNILDDDPPPTVAVADGTPNPQLEANGAQVGFTIALSAAATENVILTYSTVNGTAAAGTDFTGITNAQATITAGSLSTTVFVDLINDSVFETAEAFSLQLNSAQLAVSSTPLTITDNSGAGNVSDDDPPPPTAAVANGTPNPQLEAAGAQIGFTISLSAVASEDVILNYSTVNGTAAAGTDFTGITNAQATITAGNLSTTVFVNLINDSVFETAEAFSLLLNSAQLAVSSTPLTITDNSGAGNVSDDDPPPPPPTAAVANGTPNPQLEATGAQIGFTISLSAAASENVILTYSTVNGTATAGSDFTGITNAQAIIAAGSLSTTVYVDLINNSTAEVPESLSLQLNSAQLQISGTPLTITDNSGTGNITDNDAGGNGIVVVKIHSTIGIGSTDPSGLAYIPSSGRLYLSDSEVDESPFSNPTNLFALNTSAELQASYSLLSFTDEPTGLTFDPTTGRMFISDDDEYKVFQVDPANPTVKLGEFLTQPIGATDPEDLAINPANGHLYIVNGVPRTIVEATSSGAFVSSVTLPSVIADPEALVYDPVEGVFYVGGGFSANIWKVDTSGAIIETITLLANSVYRNPIGNTRVHVKDMEFAPSSSTTDDPGKMSLYVADYGNSHVNDGRLFELDLGSPALLASVVSPMDDFALG